VVKPSGGTDLVPGLATVMPQASGLFIVVAGRLSAAQAKSLVASRRPGTPALALLLAVSSWEAGQRHAEGPDGTEDATAVLTGAGWRVTTVRADTPLTAAWERLHQAPAIPHGESARFAPEAVL
jgi:hypothetical protein